MECWVARDVIGHLVEWFPAFLQGGTGITLPAGPSVDHDPAGAWRSQTDTVQALLDDPDTAEREHDLPLNGRMPLGQAIDMIYTSEVFLHRWDLARATGQDETLDPDKCAAMFEGMLPMDEVLRQSGQYGPRVEVADDADIQTKLLASSAAPHRPLARSTATPAPSSWRRQRPLSPGKWDARHSRQTKVWPNAGFPLIEIGLLTLDRNVSDRHTEVEQVAFGQAKMARQWHAKGSEPNRSVQNAPSTRKNG